MSDPLTIIHGDALSLLKDLPSESVQTCVTSPPYWGLRSYGTDPVVWDNHNGCEHEWSDASYVRNNDQTAGPKQRTNTGAIGCDEPVKNSFCHCGAWRGELGLEPTPELYVKHIVDIFREVKRVLRKDGTAWVNLGDSYATGGGAVGRCPGGGDHGKRFLRAGMINTQPNRMPIAGLKPKDLVGIPWRCAFALQADGWYLRSDIIWAKPNPMPESVRDRPTRSHEYIFLLSKSQKYFYDADAIAEPLDRPEELDRAKPAKFGGALKWVEAQKQSRLHSGNEYKRKQRSAYSFARDVNEGTRPNGAPNQHRPDRDDQEYAERRNKRTVWTVSTKPFSEAHFATFPPDLITPCILAGSKAGDAVLDPFAGSGTTGKVAIEIGRNAILIEPKAEYIEMIKGRCQTTIGLPL